MSVAFVLVVVGILENSMVTEESGEFTERKFHLFCMLGATVCFVFGWLFMFLQHEKGNVSHFAQKSAVTHKMHVYGGYLALLLVSVQAAGGIMKNNKMPIKSVRWHGNLARTLLALIYFWVLVFASWAGMAPGKLADKDSFLARSHLMEWTFSILFILTGVMVWVTLSKGYRPESKLIEPAGDQSQTPPFV